MPSSAYRSPYDDDKLQIDEFDDDDDDWWRS